MEDDDEAFLQLNNFTEEQNYTLLFSLEMELAPRIVWDLLFGSMLFVAVVGNLIVLWIVIGNYFFLFRAKRVLCILKSVHHALV